jgi:hypothetical protein
MKAGQIFACGLRDHVITYERNFWYQSLAPLIKLYPFEFFSSCCFRKNSLVSNFFFSLILQHISSIKKEKKSFEETFIGLCRRKLNKEKLDQINSELTHT